MIHETDDIIVKTLARLLMPFIIAYALYVVAHGHYSPGGGFQGGVILAAGFVLLVISHGMEKSKKYMTEKLACIIGCMGVCIYGGIGVLCIVLGGNFLDYGRLTKILPVSKAQSRSLGILGVEMGVALTVMAVMCTIFFVIYDPEEHPGGGDES